MPHIHEKIDFTVDVYIVFKNTVLLRMHDKYKIWLSVGGHIELDEDPVQASIREVREETGLNVSIAGNAVQFPDPGFTELISPRFLNRHDINETHEHISFIYFAKTETDELKPEEGEQQGGMQWFTAEELDNPKYSLRENVKFYAKAALKELGTK